MLFHDCALQFNNKIMAAQYLWQAGSIIITVMGSLHLYYTFFTDKFSSRNEKTVEAMKTSSPILTKDMSIWNAWIGFNATHSAGAIFMGATNFYLAQRYFTLLQSDPFFCWFTLLTMGFFVWLAQKYWFKTVLIGVSVAWACFMSGYVLTIMPL